MSACAGNHLVNTKVDSSAPPAAAPAALNAAALATPLLVGSGMVNLQCKKETAEGVCLGRSGGRAICVRTSLCQVSGVTRTTFVPSAINSTRLPCATETPVSTCSRSIRAGSRGVSLAPASKPHIAARALLSGELDPVDLCQGFQHRINSARPRLAFRQRLAGASSRSRTRVGESSDGSLASRVRSCLARRSAGVSSPAAGASSCSCLPSLWGNSAAADRNTAGTGDA